MHGVAVGDGDNDGRQEVYAANKDENVFQFRWNGSDWASQQVGAGTGSMHAVVVSDGDNDGANEVYAACGDGGVYRFKYSLQWTTALLQSVDTPLYALAVGDVDNDHYFEVYALGQNNHVYQFACASSAVPTDSAASASKYLKVYNSRINPLQGELAVIRWKQPQDSAVTITVFNLMGDRILTLVDHKKYTHEDLHEITWNGRNRAGKPVGSGIYPVVIQAAGYQARSKIAVIK